VGRVLLLPRVLLLACCWKLQAETCQQQQEQPQQQQMSCYQH
jgi:hypothetical protein